MSSELHLATEQTTVSRLPKITAKSDSGKEGSSQASMTEQLAERDRTIADQSAEIAALRDLIAKLDNRVRDLESKANVSDHRFNELSNRTNRG
jgi:ubiquinone biosynthesis protein UbiJ